MKRISFSDLAAWGFVVVFGCYILMAAHKASVVERLRRDLYPALPFKPKAVEVSVMNLSHAQPFFANVTSRRTGLISQSGRGDAEVQMAQNKTNSTYMEIWLKTDGPDLMIYQIDPDSNALSLYNSVREGKSYDFPTLIREIQSRKR